MKIPPENIELYTEVVVNCDLPEANLKTGDVALYIEHLQHPQGGEDGAILEIFNALGESLRIVIVRLSAIEPLQEDQVPSVRLLARTG